MVTKAGEPEPELTFNDKAIGLAYTITDAGESTARLVIAGDKHGSIRRILLYALVGIGIALDLPVLALVCLLLLIGTDQLA